MTPEEVQAVIANSIKKQMYIAMQYPAASEKDMMDRIGDHLAYMKEHEDRIFLSGPLLKEGVTIDCGLTVLKTDEEAEARALMDAEPLIKAGLRRYDLKRWRILEGGMSVTISGINGTVTLS